MTATGGARIQGRPIRASRSKIVTADHQSKPDVGLAIVREWFDRVRVDAISQLGNTLVAISREEMAPSARN
jgi:branched-chain amino acid transport system substrate-binding protein